MDYSLKSLSHAQALGLAVALCLLGYIVTTELRYRHLSGFPGPILARYTNAYRAYLAWRYSNRPGGISYHEYLHNKYGTTVRMGPNIVYTDDPGAIPLVLGFKDRLMKTDHVNALQVPGQPANIGGIRDEKEHNRSRSAIEVVYSLSSLKGYEPLVDETIVELTRVFEGKARAGEVVNISEWCHYYAYDSITNVTYGEPTGFIRNGRDMYDLISSQLKHISYVRVATQWPFLDYVLRTNPIALALNKQKASRASAFFQYSAERVNAEMVKEKGASAAPKTMLHHLLDARDKHPDVLDNARVQMFCTVNLLAGTLSPSFTVDFIMRWLAQHPERQERLYREVKEHCTTYPVPLDDTFKMPYLQGLVREGYRLSYASDIGMERVAGPKGIPLRDGRMLPPGYGIGLSHPAIQKDETVFGDQPQVCRPDRWMQGPNESAAEYKARKGYMDRTDLTFSKGSRNCIGKGYTQMEVAKVVASIVAKFQLRLVGEAHIRNVRVRLVIRE
ncbi:hypothetical protein MCOR25_004355 [Pyricularia grisea]|uniref:Uncharacterized protein n=1 Tax=Pyricularia grisea TaxID=148305 RepID=A0A6P8BHH2_PYRGI|nr:uncharacterized protein PgNI_02220 [Pyricularia grisea]KAI6369726.1 hypothetical protein MCOR25_004355 [Pyricularia grisea]TLD16059.1 hypothetical protein PgNI_02220 [Pyricularia grisea]